MSESELQLEEIEVVFWNSQVHLIEIFQVIGIQYAFLSSKTNGYKQCHQWVKCRDFLHDALRSQITDKRESIYGFTYEPKVNPPVDLESMRLLVKRDAIKSETNASENTREMMNSALAMIRWMEESNGIKPLSNLYCAAGNKDIYIFEGAADWMESTFMISLYTFLIRLGGRKIVFKDKEDFDSKLTEFSKFSSSDHDFRYLKTIQPFIYKIVEKRKDLKYVKEDGKRLFDDKSISLFHGYTGIVALCEVAAGGNKSGVEELHTLAACIK